MNTNYGDVGSISGDKATSTNDKSSEKRAKRTEMRGTHEEGHRLDMKKVLSEAKSLGQRLESQMSARPFVVLGAASGVSFVAGAILGRRVGQLAIAIGLGFAASRLLEGTDLKDLAVKATRDL